VARLGRAPARSGVARQINLNREYTAFDPTTPFKGSRIGQAYTIWIQTPQQTLNALLEADGMKPKGAFHADGFNIYYE
jgi:hypothetical protein